MGSAEAIVFTAGIGENRNDLRAAVCAGLEDLGVQIDPSANESIVRGKEGIISTPESRIQVLVIPCQ